MKLKELFQATLKESTGIKSDTPENKLHVGDTVEFNDTSITKLVGEITHKFKKGDILAHKPDLAYNAYDMIGGAVDKSQQQEAVDYATCYIISAKPADASHMENNPNRPIWVTKYGFMKIHKISK